MVLPVLKLGLIAVKQISKPVASRIKAAALTSDIIKQMMVRVGRRLHYNVFQLERVADGRPVMSKEQVPVLNEKLASERGADFLAEMVVFGVAAGALGIEQWESRRRERAAAAALERHEADKEAEAIRRQELNEQRQWAELSRLHQTVDELKARLAHLETRRPRWFSMSA